MELRVLHAFVEVVRQGGFSRAAKTVFSTQSTVSKAVRRLEDEVGAPLFDRVGHRSVLTETGEIVYRRAQRILAERDDMFAEIGELRGLNSGTLRLGLPRIGSSILFAPLFARYRQLYPGIDIRLVEQGSDRLEEILLSGEIDLAASLLPVSDDFEWQSVRIEPLMALVPANHELARSPAIDVDILRRQSFILFESGFGLNRIIMDFFKRNDIAPTIAARSSQIDFIVGLVAAGLGVAFLPRMIAGQRPHAQVKAVPLQDPLTDWHMALIWRHGAYLSHSSRAWLEIARQEAA
ncbi:LysR family transcriptional regulator [Pseudochelatococcus lubricantis]|uniref:LysR family transcriptional regulator n=1 Tax=Pseudochelatococcus lubricantis TaxID=1538102 RepID=UPI0035EEA40A